MCIRDSTDTVAEWDARAYRCRGSIVRWTGLSEVWESIMLKISELEETMSNKRCVVWEPLASSIENVFKFKSNSLWKYSHAFQNKLPNCIISSKYRKRHRKCDNRESSFACSRASSCQAFDGSTHCEMCIRDRPYSERKSRT